MIPLLAAAVFLAAQSPNVDTIAQQLASTDPSVVAWGAYNVATYQRDDLIPRVIHVLQNPPVLPLPSEQRAFGGAVMDALIQLNAHVPAAALVPYLEKHAVESFVLLPHARDRHAVLVDLLPRVSGFEWFSAANILLSDRSPDLPDYLARTVRLRLTVTVRDADDGGAAVAGGILGGEWGDGIGQQPREYPPHAEYRFELLPSPGFVVLATGPHPVYYSRTVTRDFQYPVSQFSISGPNDDDRLEYLRALSPFPQGTPLHALTMVSVRWSGATALEQRVSELRAEIARQFRGVIDTARQYYPVPADVVMDPPIAIGLVDRRKDRTAPLPTIDRRRRHSPATSCC